MTNIRHCSMLEFGKGAYNQEVAPGITRHLHATGSIPHSPVYLISSWS